MVFGITLASHGGIFVIACEQAAIVSASHSYRFGRIRIHAWCLEEETDRIRGTVSHTIKIYSYIV